MEVYIRPLSALNFKSADSGKSSNMGESVLLLFKLLSYEACKLF